MTKVEVRASPKNGGHRLDLYHDGVHIGEYEWSSDKHKDAKVKEAEGATELLLDAYRRQDSGEVERQSGLAHAEGDQDIPGGPEESWAGRNRSWRDTA